MKKDFHAKIFPMSGNGLFGDTEKPDSGGFRSGIMILQFERFFPFYFSPSASWGMEAIKCRLTVFYLFKIISFH